MTQALSHIATRLGNWLAGVYTINMTKRWFKTPAFLTMWLFAFSMLSNCYCIPVSFAPERSAQPDNSASATMPSHCPHHSDAAKEKQSDCAPRYNTDDIERLAVQIQPTQPVEKSFLNYDETHAGSLKEHGFLNDIGFDTGRFFNSSPPIYILIRSLLI